MLNSLPFILRKKTNHEIEYYGANYVLEKYLGTKNLLFKTSIRKWLHGWIYEPMEYPRELVFYGDESEPVLVHTKKQKIFLQNHGYINAFSIGAPFLYTKEFPQKKIKNSLLIVAPHHKPGSTFIDSTLKSYIKKISLIVKKFSFSRVLLYQDDFNNKEYLQAFERHKLKVIQGASLYDQNSLFRMRNIFGVFETVTSNVLGSHLVYAAYCNCKISLYGPYNQPKKSMLAKDEFYKRYIFIQQKLLKTHKKVYFHQYKFLHCHPKNAKKHRKWANLELGKKEKKTIQELKNIFFNSWESSAMLKLKYLLQKHF